MTVFSARDAATLILEFENSRPISAIEIGRLLGSIGQEYRNLYRSDLIVVEAREGSYKIILASVVASLGLGLAAVGHANNLFDFAGHLQTVSRSLSGQAPNSSQPSIESPGFKSVEAIVKLASGSGSAVDITYRDPSGAQLSVKMSPPEALRAGDRAKELKREFRPAKRDLVTRGTQEAALVSMVRRQVGMAQDGPGVDALVQLVRAVEASGQGPLLSRIADDLDQQGDHRSATAIRAARTTPDGGRVTVF